MTLSHRNSYSSTNKHECSSEVRWRNCYPIHNPLQPRSRASPTFRAAFVPIVPGVGEVCRFIITELFHFVGFELVLHAPPPHTAVDWLLFFPPDSSNGCDSVREGDGCPILWSPLPLLDGNGNIWHLQTQNIHPSLQRPGGLGEEEGGGGGGGGEGGGSST